MYMLMLLRCDVKELLKWSFKILERPLSHGCGVTIVLVSYWPVDLSVKARLLASWTEWQRRASAVYVPNKMGNISSWRTLAIAFFYKRGGR